MFSILTIGNFLNPLYIVYGIYRLFRKRARVTTQPSYLIIGFKFFRNRLMWKITLYFLLRKYIINWYSFEGIVKQEYYENSWVFPIIGSPYHNVNLKEYRRKMNELLRDSL